MSGTDEALDEALVGVFDTIKAGLSITVGGVTFTADKYMLVDGADYYNNVPVSILILFFYVCTFLFNVFIANVSFTLNINHSYFDFFLHLPTLIYALQKSTA